MVQADYRGARGANAGDDFHELWVLRQALALLDQDAELTAVAVEGLRAEDERGTPRDTWDGVDCTFYFGGDQAASAERIVIDQLKYSAANPDRAWTVARLTESSNKRQDNSVLRRLAKAFMGLKEKRPDLVANGKVVVRLVSKQPVNPGVIKALSNRRTADQGSRRRSGRQSDRATLLAASGLQGEDFEVFANTLDFSECGSGSRFAIEERVLATISDWTDQDARTTVNDLMRSVRRAMMPEAKGELIVRESVLTWMGFSDRGALFPCPPSFERVDRLIPRRAAKIVVEKMLGGNQRICLHGEGGCGKTTALQEIESLLPTGSVVIAFDCYGSGRYLDSDAYRHLPWDAFLQLSNDLARELRIPLLISRSEDLDYPRVFKRRLEKAAEGVATRGGDALLVIAVDAADNSVTAASSRNPPEKSFVHDFVALGALPPNTRFIVTGRTGNLPKLHLPHNFSQHKISGFTRDETAMHVRGFWNDAPDVWIEDFDILSRGNPRVQRYALQYAGANPERALDYLRPNGKTLDQIFQDQLKFARDKTGVGQDIEAFCSGLIALPRPVPISDLAAVTGLSEAQIRDLCNDLAPGVRLTNGSIGFADVEFEHFFRTEAGAKLQKLQMCIADHFLGRHKSDAYAAAHIAEALFVAGRGQEIISLINAAPEPTAIGDPVLQRETQLKRLQTAMKVCREAGNTIDAMLTLLIGAEALKTDAVIRHMFIENPDLAANFAHETSRKIILRNPKELEHHGPLLFHLMAADARDGDGISVREGHRQVGAWLQRRDQNVEDQRREHPNSEPRRWAINDRDIAAETEALLRTAGPRQAVDALLRWRPKSVALRVASILSLKLIIAGDADLVERCVSEANISTPWDLFLLTPLALAGKEVDLSRLEASLASLLRCPLIRLDQLKETGGNDNATAEYLDIILTACEVMLAHDSNRTSVIPVLERIADREERRRDRLFTSQVSFIDLSLRAYSLLERLAGRRPTLEMYLVDPPDPPGELPPKELEQLKRADAQKKSELQDFIGPLVDVYDVRAQALLGAIAPGEIETHLRTAIDHYLVQEYRRSRDFTAQAMDARIALSITRLMAIPGLARTVLLDLANLVMGGPSNTFRSAEVEIFAYLAMDRSLHRDIVSVMTTRSKVVRNLRVSAEEKLTALIHIARLLLPISYGDADALFKDAIDVAGEVNFDAVHEIALFAPLAENAVVSMDVSQRRAVAHDLAVVVCDAHLRLGGYESFPWGKAAQALTTLDLCLALAATARWDDASIVDHAILLPSILETALRRRELLPPQVVAFLSLLDDARVDFMVHIIEEASRQTKGHDPMVLTEDLAREELLRFGRGTRPLVSETLTSVAMGGTPGFWLDQLIGATTFHQKERPGQASQLPEGEYSPGPVNPEMPRFNPLDSIHWASHRFISADEIQDMIGHVFAVAQASESFVPVSAILDRIGEAIAPGDRVLHLEALSRAKSTQIPDYELAQAIARRIEDWHEAPSVNRWCRERLIHVVMEHLPSFSGWLAHDGSPLPALLERSGLAGQRITDALLAGMELHADVFNAPTIYALVGLLGKYCDPGDAAQVIMRQANRLVQRIPGPERDHWDLADIPTEPAGGVARFLYACMGDVAVQTRWRAAHALRRLVRFGDTKTIENLVNLYGRTLESSYRRPDAPFYWLAARLWLVMAFDRIATESPSAVAQHGRWLLDIASDREFPHVLVRSFAKSAVSKLAEGGALALDAAQRKTLKHANTSPVRRKKGGERDSVGFDRYRYRESEGRRFRFYSMDDILPYRYTEALRTFADVSGEELLDVAERWIVERWGVQNNPWRWEDEPRQHRFTGSSSSMDYSSGSGPALERFHAYLAWHAMWCATGELMRTRALARVAEDDGDTFERWLTRAGLTAPPLWLADLCCMKPLEDRLWFPPQKDVNVWIEEIDESDFLAELGLVNEDGTIVVGSYHSTKSRSFLLSVRLETALVSPDTAGALVRALQSIDTPWHYRIPPAGDELEIDVPPYQLVGWLADVERETGIDERDPLRYGVHTMRCRPASRTATVLNLQFVFDHQARWVEADSRKAAFFYEAWGDNRGDETEDRLRYDTTVRSSGWRLRADKEALKAFLDEMSRDLIVEVEVTRRNKGYDSSRYDTEVSREARFDRVLLLRRNGTIETAKGRLGTWAAPRT